MNRRIFGMKKRVFGQKILFCDIDRNGRWRSKWSLAFSKGQTECELIGLVKAQVKRKEKCFIHLMIWDVFRFIILKMEMFNQSVVKILPKRFNFTYNSFLKPSNISKSLYFYRMKQRLQKKLFESFAKRRIIIKQTNENLFFV